MRSRLMLFPLAALLACGGSDSTSPGVTPGGTGGTGGTTTPTVTTAVTLQGNQFAPKAIRVSPSATVTFTNSDGYPHNVTFASSTITNIGNFSSGNATAAMPATAGTYAYSCTLHAGMNGTIQVQ
jgi:plastocyanin